jgi:hypothetical protein
MNQGELFEPAQETVPSPLCHRWDDCSPKGRAILGQPEDCGGCINRAIVCQTCGCTGVESTRKDLMR